VTCTLYRVHSKFALIDASHVLDRSIMIQVLLHKKVSMANSQSNENCFNCQSSDIISTILYYMYNFGLCEYSFTPNHIFRLQRN
jgi:hypothetical protein